MKSGKHQLLVIAMIGCILLYPLNVVATSLTKENQSLEEEWVSTALAEDPDLKYEHTPTMDEDFKDDCVLVVLKHKYSAVNQKIDVAMFETSQLKATSTLEKESTVYDETALKNNSLILFSEIQDLTYIEPTSRSSSKINEELFNNILRVQLKTTGKEKVIAAVEELKKVEEVLDAVPDYNYYIQEDVVPDDLYYNNDDAWGLKKINIESAWDITTGDSNVKVGVMERGIASHPDLDNHVLTGNSTPADNADLSHGTHLAGIIGAISDNEIGIAGIAQVSLVPLNGTLRQVFDYATQNNIWIINASFHYTYAGAPAPANTVDANAIQQYKGLLICAAGNRGVNTDNAPQYPADYPCNNIISVANMNDNDKLYEDDDGGSNYGAITVDLAAPGVGILSTYPPTMCGNDTTSRAHKASGYHTMTGTSMAAPHVTGVAALIKSRYPDLTATQIKAAIMEGVTPVAALSGKCVTGGRLNAKGALDKAALFGTRKIVSGDFNGDGKDDVASIIAESGHHTQFAVQLSNGSGFGDQTAWFDNASYAATGIDQRAVAGDFNGDGKDDLAVLYNYGDGDLKFFTYLSTGSQFTTSQQWYDWYAGADYIDNRFVAGDFNGDGKDDVAVMFRYPSGTVNIFTFISNGSSFTRQTWNEWSADMSYVENRFVAGDFNGDGKDDTAVLFCYPNGTVNLFVFCSNGSSFTRVNWLNWSANVSYIENRFTVGDFDGNAKDDAVVLFQYPSGQSNLFTFMSNGGYFTRENWYQWDA